MWLKFPHLILVSVELLREPLGGLKLPLILLAELGVAMAQWGIRPWMRAGTPKEEKRPHASHQQKERIHG